MKTILHLITDLRVGGTASLLLERVTRLREFHHEVLAFDRVTASGLCPRCVHGSGPADPPELSALFSAAGVRVHLLGHHRPRDAALSWLEGRMRRVVSVLLRETHPDLLHSTLYHSHLLAAWMAGRSGVLTVASKEGVEWRRSILERRMEGIALRRAARVIAVSQAARDVALRLGVPGDRVCVLPNGIDLDRPGRWTVPREDADGAFPRLVGVGRLDPAKGWQDLLEALPILLRRWPNLRLDLLGQGAFETALRHQTERLGLASRVHFGTPSGLAESPASPAVAVPSAPVPPAPASAAPNTILVVPSREEGFGLVLLEGMARGLPIVATLAGGIPEVARDGREALLVHAADPPALARALERVITDTALAGRLAAAGRERVRAFGIERSMEAYGGLYREVLEEAG